MAQCSTEATADTDNHLHSSHDLHHPGWQNLSFVWSTNMPSSIKLLSFPISLLSGVTRYNFSQQAEVVQGFGEGFCSLEQKDGYWWIISAPLFPLNLNLMSRAIAASYTGQQNEKLEKTWVLEITDLLHQPWTTCIFILRTSNNNSKSNILQCLKHCLR